MEESDDVRNRDTTRPIDCVNLRRRSDIEKTVEIEISHVVIHGADVYAPQRLVADAEHFRPIALRRNVFITPPTLLKQPVVVPPRSSQTRSVFARFLVRLSGYGILTDVTRLTTLRTSSRSAADAGGQEMPCSRTASTKSVDLWSIGNAFPGRAHSLVTELRPRGDILTAATNGRWPKQALVPLHPRSLISAS